MDTLNTVQSCTTVQSRPGLRYSLILLFFVHHYYHYLTFSNSTDRWRRYVMHIESSEANDFLWRKFIQYFKTMWTLCYLAEHFPLMALHFFPLDGFLTSVSAMTYHSRKRILAAIHEVLPTANLSTTNDLFLLISWPDRGRAAQLSGPIYTRIYGGSSSRTGGHNRRPIPASRPARPPVRCPWISATL